MSSQPRVLLFKLSQLDVHVLGHAHLIMCVCVCVGGGVHLLLPSHALGYTQPVQIKVVGHPIAISIVDAFRRIWNSIA